MQIFSMTNEELEDKADIVKQAVLAALVKDGMLKAEAADEWAEKNTVLHRRKSLFRTLTDKWSKEKYETNLYHYIVVSKR